MPNERWGGFDRKGAYWLVLLYVVLPVFRETFLNLLVEVLTVCMVNKRCRYCSTSSTYNCILKESQHILR